MIENCSEIARKTLEKVICESERKCVKNVFVKFLLEKIKLALL